MVGGGVSELEEKSSAAHFLQLPRPGPDSPQTMAMTEPLSLSAILDDPLAGTPYRAIAPAGGGAMGEVLEAEHRALKKRVMVKLVRAEHAGSSAMEDRMRLEAQSASALSGHPNIVEILDLGRTEEGRPYLVMERLVGRTLKQEVAARGPLPVAEALGLLRQLLAGLAAAHRAGLVHRDIKPDNLFLCEPGADGARRLKILDFGIVKVVSAGKHAPRPLAIPTGEGMAIGTPRFLSPEQALGRPVDARADLYAAGCVLFWLIAGCDPFFDRDGLLAIVQAHASETPPRLSTIAAQAVPVAVDELVIWALEKKPEHRFASAEEMAAALEIAAARPASVKRWARTEPLDTRAFRPAAVPDESEAATLPALRLAPILAPRPPQPAHIGAGTRTAFVIAALLFVALAALLLYRLGQGVTM
jgi:serine/threonine-protein kinase